MRLEPFALERYFARYEFTVRHNLAASDVEGLRLDALLALADDEARELWHNLALGYTESAGHPLLRREIAALDGLTPDDVLVCAGAEEAIYLAVQAALAPGDHAIVVWPAYQSLHEVARATGSAVTLVELRHDEQWRLDVRDIQAAIRPATRLVAINFPHNPTGAHLPAGDLLGLAALCEARGITLLSDEVYRFLEYDVADRLPAAATLGEHTVSVGVMSKSFALAGIRIGWLASRDRDLLARAAVHKDYTTICNAAPSEILAIIALRARETILARSRALVMAALPEVRALMAEQADHLDWVEPRAGSVCFPRLRHGSADAWTARLVEEAGVLLLPGSQFGHGGEHFRLGLGRADAGEAIAIARRFARHSLCDAANA